MEKRLLILKCKDTYSKYIYLQQNIVRKFEEKKQALGENKMKGIHRINQ
jgi:hypothetical protein